jgi:hypothetical protein
MNALLGALSETPVVVTHIVGSGIPTSEFVATQPAGWVGALTSSKFSVQGGSGARLGIGVGLVTGVGDGVPPGVAVVIGMPLESVMG